MSNYFDEVSPSRPNTRVIFYQEPLLLPSKDFVSKISENLVDISKHIRSLKNYVRFNQGMKIGSPSDNKDLRKSMQILFRDREIQTLIQLFGITKTDVGSLSKRATTKVNNKKGRTIFL